MDYQKEIENQRHKVTGNNPTLNLVSPCRKNNGIYTVENKKKYISKFNSEIQELTIGAFTPASGSGSRMFEFIYNFLQEPSSQSLSEIEKFLSNIGQFAFFKKLPTSMQKRILDYSISLEEFASYLIEDENLKFNDSPKGLIPFHVVEPFILNPFQEHLLQSKLLPSKQTLNHFTIQGKYKDRIEQAVNLLSGMTGMDFHVSYSEQNPGTDSFVFDENGEVVLEKNGNSLRRPAGHGAILTNLNQIDADLILVKNIDNIQHYHKTDLSVETWSIISGLLLEIKEEIHDFIVNGTTWEALRTWNEKYHLFHDSELTNAEKSKSIHEFLNRPIRVCGMVKNDGQPGGGPFWVENEGIITKQIVEKAQIAQHPEQYKLMLQSTHFNPVMMALVTKDFNGEIFDLKQFIDESAYFIVEKSQAGKKVKFVELPGLWNGSMANWITLFVEIPSETFSPVKNILDLLQPLHLAN